MPGNHESITTGGNTSLGIVKVPLYAFDSAIPFQGRTFFLVVDTYSK